MKKVMIQNMNKSSNEPRCGKRIRVEKSFDQEFLKNHTWEIVDLSSDCKPLGPKWIFKRKMKLNGFIDKYKSKLVIKGYM